ncbi:MAG: sugar phosphate isomerase/epimerase [Planctomycetes bacterium]|nr:sugar phosphate isomerase/epimerase [Planctomycetota bacterium]
MTRLLDRRTFLQAAGGASAGLAIAGMTGSLPGAQQPAYQISLAEWSLHRALKANQLDNRDFAKVAKQDYGIDAIEYVDQFFSDKAKDQQYLGELKTRAADLGVKIQLIMIDTAGALGEPDDAKRTGAVEKHYQWVEAAKFLGCHSIRVNARSRGSYEEQQKLAADGLRRLSEFAAGHQINVIVENHGGFSSNGQWLASVMKMVALPNCGTLPDFGNFRVAESEEYDRYKGVAELMPFAKAVSAKSYDFDAEGNETTIDYARMMKIVLDAGYHGYVGIEYEGRRLSEPEGILATKKLLEKVRASLA